MGVCVKVIILDMGIKYFLGGQNCFQVFFRGNIFLEVLAPPSVYHRSPPPGGPGGIAHVCDVTETS